MVVTGSVVVTSGELTSVGMSGGSDRFAPPLTVTERLAPVEGSVVVTGVSVVEVGVSDVATGVSVVVSVNGVLVSTIVIGPVPGSDEAAGSVESPGTGTSLGVPELSEVSSAVVESSCVLNFSVVEDDLRSPTRSSPRGSAAATAATVNVSSAVSVTARGRCRMSRLRGLTMKGAAAESSRPSSLLSDGSTRVPSVPL
ncbi:hypothetical protein [Nocardia heshunensis]